MYKQICNILLILFGLLLIWSASNISNAKTKDEKEQKKLCESQRAKNASLGLYTLGVITMTQGIINMYYGNATCFNMNSSYLDSSVVGVIGVIVMSLAAVVIGSKDCKASGSTVSLLLGLGMVIMSIYKIYGVSTSRGDVKEMLGMLKKRL